MAESNGSLLPGLWRDSLHVTCGLTVHRDQLRAQRSVTSMGKLYLFTGGTAANVHLLSRMMPFKFIAEGYSDSEKSV